ncbi:MAG: triose-phosphate isomerase [Bacteroidota bacterium]
MRKLIAAGNWKMNLSASEAKALATEVVELYKAESTGKAEVIMGAPFPYLPLISEIVAGVDGVHVAAQNVAVEAKGAYTGETAAQMIASVGVSHVIIGHSERRSYYGETNEILAKKVDQALVEGLVPIYCIGETLDQREAGQTLDVNKVQLAEGVFHLSEADFSKVIVAYEPVWAIGTGKTASPEQAQEVHAFIRKQIAEKYSEAVADNTTILYGGSMKPANAESLLAQPDIDGGLIGGASLKARSFADIIKSF